MSSSAVNIPLDIVSDIITRLPVKPLLRFRCVCKSFLSLIDSPNFVNSHLARSKSNTPYAVTKDTDLRAYTLSGHENAHFDFKNLSPDVQKFSLSEFVGSVNGIVCLSLDKENVVLWNPSTRNYFELPSVSTDRPSGIVLPEEDIATYGFGFDDKNNDYKVVRTSQCFKVNPMDMFDGVIHWDIRIFSLKLREWRRWRPGFPHPIRYVVNSPRFVNGRLHWLVTPGTFPYRCPQVCDIVILAFDLASEEYQVFPQPDYPNKIVQVFMVVLEGFLGLVCDFALDNVDLWIMKEYGVKESWTRLFSIDQCQFLRPIAYSGDRGQVLLERDWQELVWYDLKSKNIKELGIQGDPKFNQESFLYVESLVQLPSPNKISLKDEKRTKEKNSNKRDGFLSKGFSLVL